MLRSSQTSSPPAPARRRPLRPTSKRCAKRRLAHEESCPPAKARPRRRRRAGPRAAQHPDLDREPSGRTRLAAHEDEPLAVGQEARPAVRRLLCPGDRAPSPGPAPPSCGNAEERPSALRREDDHAIRAPGSAAGIGASASSRGGPPARSTRFSLPPAKKPTERPSGEKKGAPRLRCQAESSAQVVESPDVEPSPWPSRAAAVKRDRAPVGPRCRWGPRTPCRTEAAPRAEGGHRCGPRRPAKSTHAAAAAITSAATAQG